ncbi:MAG: hisC [Peptococcaceae bacterium]|jgi:histidinol-phosphate aminotransferase|nr:hisC [Peptococcaceae bacterium]
MRKSITHLTPYNPGKSLKQLEQEIGKKIIKLSANESLWGPSPRVQKVLQDALNLLHLYPDGMAFQLKEALATLWGLKISNFILGNGADELILMTALAFLNPGDEVIIPTPTFSEYETAVTIAGAKPLLINQPALRFDLPELAKSVSAKTRMVFLCNPNNPTGTSFTHEELKTFLESLPHDILVVLDEAYCHYAADPHFPSSRDLIKAFPNLMVLRTFSKVFALASLRVGYAVGREENMKIMEKVRQPFNVNTLGQCAALAALQDQTYTAQVITETIKERTWLTGELTILGLNVLPSQANFILVEWKKDASLAVQKLLHEGILVRNTASFGLPDWLRITIGPHPQMEALVLALSRVLS